jgi:tetratricopeptide (TPR) repeat protein
MLNQMKVSSIENTAENRAYFRDLISRVSSNPFSDQTYLRKSAERLFDATESEESLKILNSLVLKHPSSPENYYSRSTVYFKIGRLDLAIQDQEKLLELDPWNASNMLKLGENYGTLNDITKMKTMRNKILALTGDSEISNLANEKLQLP